MSDGNGKPLVGAGTTPMTGKGTITFSIRLPSLAYNMCGWVYKNSSGLMTKGTLKKRWMVLYDFKLKYFDSQYTLDEVRGEINCGDITGLVEVPLISLAFHNSCRRNLRRMVRPCG